MKSNLYLVLMMVLGLGACGKSEKPPSDISPSIKSIPTYQVGTIQPYPPFALYNSNKQLVGLDMDILNEIASNQGFKLNFQALSPDTIFLQLENEHIDIAANGFARDDLEGKNVIASDSYLRSRDCLLAKNYNNLNHWKDKRIATDSGSGLVHELPKKFNIPRNRVHEVKTEFEAIMWLMNNQADIVISGCLVLNYQENSTSLRDFHFVKMFLPETNLSQTADLVFVVKSGNTELLSKINAGLRNLRETGRLSQIIQKWE